MSRLAFALTHKLQGGRPVVELVEPMTVLGFTVPVGFRTDFASIPWPVSLVLPVFGRSARAAVLHDFLCWRQWDRAGRSAMFLELMLADGVPRLQAWLQFVAVRWWPWETVTDEPLEGGS